MDEERKTLTLKRPAPKADANELTAGVIKTPASLSAPGTVTVRKGKKTIVNVTQPPKWKKKKPTATPQLVAKKEKQKLAPKPKPKPAPLVKVPKKVKPPRSPRRVTLEYAIAQLAPHWPTLFNPRGLKLMVAGMPRYGLDGEEQGVVSQAEQAYAFEKMSEIWQSRVTVPTSNGEVL